MAFFGKKNDVRERRYYYLRSGYIHCTVRTETDYAVKLSADEEERIKKEITDSPASKFYKLRDFWNFLTLTKGEKPINFTSYMNKVCDEKRKLGGDRA